MLHWVFGYGSLLWNPGFPYTEERKVRLNGWGRRLWQGSTDHRGTVDYPGLVCTLVESLGEDCWGVAYAVRAEDWEEVQRQLDYREKDGYQLRRLAAHWDDQQLECWVYVAAPDNQSYIGERPLFELAERIQRAQGESGPNIDYVVRLSHRLLELGFADQHVSELVELALAENKKEPE